MRMVQQRPGKGRCYIPWCSPENNVDRNKNYHSYTRTYSLHLPTDQPLLTYAQDAVSVTMQSKRLVLCWKFDDKEDLD